MSENATTNQSLQNTNEVGEETSKQAIANDAITVNIGPCSMTTPL